MDDINSLRNLVVRRVINGHGWAVHTHVMESIDGNRVGYNLRNDGTRMDIYNEAGLHHRGARHWNEIDEGDYIIRVEGNHCTSGQYLCFCLRLVLQSGRVIEERATGPWEGAPFSFPVEQPGLLRAINFNRRGRCVGLDVVQTSIHLPIRSRTMIHLPMDIREKVRLILLCGHRVRISLDALWLILGNLFGMDLCPPKQT